MYASWICGPRLAGANNADQWLWKPTLQGRGIQDSKWADRKTVHNRIEAIGATTAVQSRWNPVLLDVDEPNQFAAQLRQEWSSQ